MKTLLINSVKFSCNIVVYLPCIMRLVVIFSCNNVVLLYYCSGSIGESIDLVQGRKHARDIVKWPKTEQNIGLKIISQYLSTALC